MRVALAGAGMMGHGMGRRLLDAGFSLRVLAHRQRQTIDDLVLRGAGEAADAGDLARSADVLLLCLPNSEVVESVLAAMWGAIRPGTVVLDVGTSAPEANRALAERLATIGAHFAEAPLTGGPAQAAEGVLGAMVGAGDAVFATIQPLLASFCASIVHIGPPGAASTAKLISNYLVMGMIATISETYVAARKAGIDWGKLYAVMQRGSNSSEALRRIVEPALDGNFDGYRFAIANAAKDLRYYGNLAEELGTRTPLYSEIARFFEAAVEAGHGEKTVSRLIDPALDGEGRGAD
nr:NAD(P)-dependent oxidoreductase [uncultured Gellertiella sp.]